MLTAAIESTNKSIGGVKMESKSISQILREHPIVMASWALGLLVMWGGVITAAVGLIFWNLDVVLAGIIIFGASWLIKLPSMFFTLKMERKNASENAVKIQQQRNRELDRIRATMTPAEWELYKIQLDNQKLLNEIKNKPGATSSGPRAMYGFTQDIGG